MKQSNAIRHAPAGPAARRYNRQQLRSIWPVSDMTVWRAEQERGFPRHVTINKRNYWPADAVDAWLEARVREGGSPRPAPENL